MSKNTVYPWWQVASDIAASKGKNDAALEELAQAIKQRMAHRIQRGISKEQTAHQFLSYELEGWGEAMPGAMGQTIKRHMADLIIQRDFSRELARDRLHGALILDAEVDDEVDEDGRDPVQVAAETPLSQCIYRALKDGRLQAYYSDSRPMRHSDVLNRGMRLGGVCVEPVEVNALLKANKHPDVWVPDQAQEQPGNGRGLLSSATQEKEILHKLRANGHDPKKLPKNEPGKPGVKSEIRKALGTAGAWAGSTVFDKAWERLRGYGDIADE